MGPWSRPKGPWSWPMGPWSRPMGPHMAQNVPKYIKNQLKTGGQGKSIFLTAAPLLPIWNS